MKILRAENVDRRPEYKIVRAPFAAGEVVLAAAGAGDFGGFRWINGRRHGGTLNRLLIHDLAVSPGGEYKRPRATIKSSSEESGGQTRDQLFVGTFRAVPNEISAVLIPRLILTLTGRGLDLLAR